MAWIFALSWLVLLAWPVSGASTIEYCSNVNTGSDNDPSMWLRSLYALGVTDFAIKKTIPSSPLAFAPRHAAMNMPLELSREVAAGAPTSLLMRQPMSTRPNAMIAALVIRMILAAVSRRVCLGIS